MASPLTFQALIAELRGATEPDERERLYALLERQHVVDLGEVANAVQTRLWSIEVGLRESLRQQFGATNEMLSTLLDGQREQGAAVGGLRDTFHDGMAALGERMSDLEGRTAAVERKVAEHDQSRDRSIAERRELFAELRASKVDRASIHEELAEARQQRHDMTDALARIEEALIDRPTLVQRFMRLEAAIFGSSGVPGDGDDAGE